MPMPARKICPRVTFGSAAQRIPVGSQRDGRRPIPLTSSETRTLEHVPMTEANRRAIYGTARFRGEPGETPDKDSDKLVIDAKLRRRLTGRYQLTPTFIFTVTDRDAHLMVGITNQPTQEVYPDSPTRWSYRGVDATLEFTLTKAGPARSLILHQNGIRQTARRID